MGRAAQLVRRTARVIHPRTARKLVRKARKTAPLEWRAQVRQLPIDPSLVVYESFAGNGMLCNPEAIFRALLADPEQQHLRHVWVLTDPKAYPSTVSEFQGDHRVRFVKRGSFAYYKALATAGLLFNNATFPAEFGKREGQVYVNTWHGTPLKRMGYDEPNGAVAARNVLRNLMMADYLLSTSEFMSQQMYEQAYRLQNVYPGLLVQEGYPRTDRQVVAAGQRSRVLGRLRAEGLTIVDGETVVLYAPTWRGESFHTPTNDAHVMGERVRQLSEQLPAGHRVLLKVHQQVYEFAQAQPELRGVLVPNHIATNELLGVTDVLVSDYSSIFFDFLSTGRPIVFFTPDLADYDGYRGFYLDRDELPGPSASTEAELAGLIVAAGTGDELDPLVSHAARYEAARERFAPYDDGQATQRVLDVVVRGRHEGRRVRPVHRDGRKTMLLYLGGMKSNGITTSALNLLHHLDYSELDVSVLYNHARGREKRTNVGAIDARVRSFPRIGGFAPSKTKRGKVRRLYSRGTAMDPADFAEVERLLEQEWRRTVGQARFDYVVDFSGYAPFWTFLLSSAPAGSHSVWMHNDLKADQLREVDGKRPHYDNLGAVFSSYSRFEHLVSVSSALRDINAANLAEYGPPEKFVSARNTINHELILRKAHGDRALLEAWPGDHVLELQDPIGAPHGGGAHRSLRAQRHEGRDRAAGGHGAAAPGQGRRHDVRDRRPALAGEEPPASAGGVRHGPPGEPRHPAGRHRRGPAASVAGASGRATGAQRGRHLHRSPAQPVGDHGPVRLLRAVQRLRGPADGDPRGQGPGPSRGVDGVRLGLVGAAAGRRPRGRPQPCRSCGGAEQGPRG